MIINLQNQETNDLEQSLVKPLGFQILDFFIIFRRMVKDSIKIFSNYEKIFSGK